ncbi:C40 family peptidase [Sediminibacillus albus]|uniref:NlpC/P60 family protein n=1 Tax=Sediminibacillus albus TaxID=407036 RepID=A0A1G8ZIF3_9BACI|nr:C40 family peptidase [Sediminibacillus albus]SDK14808.1 NlpC/P60 family protein [Sediminibacillus albus]
MTTKDNVWVVNVPVATLWTSPESPRQLDEPGISNPVDLEAWLNRLTYPLRLDLCDKNLVQSQLLYGEQVKVIESKEEWTQVIIPTQPSIKDTRGYPGWLPTSQIQQTNKQAWSGLSTAQVTSKRTTLYDSNSQPYLELSYLTELPVLEEDESTVCVRLPAGSGFLSKEDIHIYQQEMAKGSGDDIVQAGEAFLGLPYFWGGMSSFGYDCSGFAYNMHKANGYQIPRDATDQATMDGEEIPLDQLEPGDLLFFSYDEGKGKLHHVGIYYGAGKMLHSPTTGKNVEITTLAGTVYETELCGARRYWQKTEAKQ